MMKKVLYSSAAIVLLSGSGLAADLSHVGVNAPEAIVPDSFDWSGFYAGISGGALSSNASVELESVGGDLLPADIDNGTLPRSVYGEGVGGMLGVQAGYNAQFGNFVLGVEGDIAWAQANGSAEFSAIDPGNPYSLPVFVGQETITRFRTSIDGLATLRARAGVTADRALFYVTGGLAAAQVENEFSIAMPGLNMAFGPWSDSGVLWGLAAGAGIEYAVTDTVTAKLEYIHYDLADRTIRGTDSGIDAMFGPQHIEYNFLNNGNLIRGGINFKF